MKKKESVTGTKTELTYTEMLDRVYERLPKQALSKDRFEMPKLDSLIQGPKTLVKNFEQVMKTLRREKEHAIKYLTKELATAAIMEEGNLVLKGKFEQGKLQRTLDGYIQQYVLCRECKKPDTKLSEQKGVKILKCEACGAAAPVKD